MQQVGGIWSRKRESTHHPFERVQAAFAALGLRPVRYSENAPVQSSGSAPEFYADHDQRCLADEDGNWIIADARIDGQTDLVRQLGNAAFKPNETDDWELILAAYRKWGEHCPRYLIGDYAFVIWDAQRGQLFCARDHIGARPLFLSLTADRIVFSSAIKCLLDSEPAPPKLNEDYAAKILNNGNYYHNQQTFYQSITKLPPGHSMTICQNDVALECYWQPRKLKPLNLRSDDEYAEALRSLLSDAIEDRLRTDRKVATHVSGGLDSSAITCIANQKLQQHNRAKPIGLSWQPDGEDEEKPSLEYRLIGAVKEQEKIEIHHVVPDVTGLYEMFLRDGTWAPCGKTLLQEDNVQKHAAKHGIGVILSGWGGDQLISNSGSNYLSELLLSGQWATLYKSTGRTGFARLKAIVSRAIVPVIWPQLPYILANRKVGRPVKRRSRMNLINPKFKARMRPPPPGRYTSAGVRQSQLAQLEDGHITRRIEEWTANALPHNIEYRFPLLDRRIVEFALTIPSSQFQRGEMNRWIFRNALRDILPETVCWNQDKSEVERFNSLLRPFLKAVAKIRRQLISGELRTTRQSYVDMDALIAFTDPATFEQSKSFGVVDNALRFLDLIPTEITVSELEGQEKTPIP